MSFFKTKREVWTREEHVVSYARGLAVTVFGRTFLLEWWREP